MMIIIIITILLLISGCWKITQTDYKQWHDRVAKIIHWNFCKKYGLEVARHYYDHQIEKVLENSNAKILWDFQIQMNRHLEHNTPDIKVVEPKKVWFIDIAIAGDSRVEEKELEKIVKYRVLIIEVGRLWQKLVPIVIGVFGSISKNLRKHLKTLNANDITPAELQKTALLGTTYILQHYLNNS